MKKGERPRLRRIATKLCFPLVIAVFYVGIWYWLYVYSLRGAPPKFDAADTEEWFAKGVAYLQEFRPTIRTPSARIYTDRYGRVRYDIDHAGLIRLTKGGWVYIIVHSSHEEDGVGDVILAVDSEGNLYRNGAHVCGGIAIEPKSGEELETAEEFLSIPLDLPEASRWKLIQPSDSAK